MTPCTCKYMTVASLPYPSIRPWPHHLPLYLSLCVLSLRTQQLDGRRTNIAFQLAVRTFNLKVLPLYLLRRCCHPLLQGHMLFLVSYCMCEIPCIQVKIVSVSSVSTTIVHLTTPIIPCKKTNSPTTIQRNPLTPSPLSKENRIPHPGPSRTCPFISLWSG